ncbi:hypothetical protein P4G96_04100 [Bacillus cereus]|nr:hypothetical protein [Bacillus cereus]MEB8666856.1 hypothetical protein [Bacillus cereus]
MTSITFSFEVPPHSQAIVEVLSNNVVYGVAEFTNNTNRTKLFNYTFNIPNGVVIDEVRTTIVPL